MPRQPRFVLPGVPVHIVHRGNNRNATFFEREDYANYLRWLGCFAKEASCSIHAYVLMTNHVHILVTPHDAAGLYQMMKPLAQQYSQYINRRYRRSGALWEGRYRSSIVQTEGYLLTCCRYIEQNPVRAGMVQRPGEYPWSSYHGNALGRCDPLLSPHPFMQLLGSSVAEWTEAYRTVLEHGLEDDTLANLRRAYRGNYVVGNDEFMADLERLAGRSMRPRVPGRRPTDVAAEIGVRPSEGKLPGK